MNQKILIFIITYKASFRVIDVIEKIPFGYIKKLNYEVYISDDNSNDDTLTYIENIKKKYPEIVFKLNHKNIGYGGNIKRCLRYAFDNKFDYAIMLHGDDQYNAKYIKDMIESFKLNKDPKLPMPVNTSFECVLFTLSFIRSTASFPASISTPASLYFMGFDCFCLVDMLASIYRGDIVVRNLVRFHSDYNRYLAACIQHYSLTYFFSTYCDR